MKRVLDGTPCTPDQQVYFQPGIFPSASQARALLSAEAGIALMRTLPLGADNVASRLLFNEAIVLDLPADHPKACSDYIELCEAAGVYPKVVQKAAQIHTLIGLVACEFGVALVPESIANAFMRDTIVYRHILPVTASPNPALGLYVSWYAHNDSPLINRYMSLLDSNPKPEKLATQGFTGSPAEHTEDSGGLR
ncbi:LysR family substrate-binding domain-containing protein [Pseudomonas sp. NPDC096917]|uniref:LysR family substrate-binding domain-containing protein n=1 Tax=Pseudomonas sp. NPDC096917 TaxID=3364483 RepID=UPI00383A7A0C